MTTSKTIIPSKIFVVPYRDRPIQRDAFLKQMQEVLLVDEPKGSYRIIFAHQCDKRPFNRGAMKNLGFWAVKRMYPLHYMHMTIIFHDVDTFPAHKGLINYDSAVEGRVSHFYGMDYALGGMVSIKGGDFLKSKGFPNFWGWGLEDNLLNTRCLSAGLTINRDCFYQMRDPLIIRLFDGYVKNCFRREAVIYKIEKPDDMFALKKVKWTIHKINPKSNGHDDDDVVDHSEESGHIFDVRITDFTCDIPLDEDDMISFDIRQSCKIKIDKNYRRRVWKLNKMFSHNNT